MNRLSSVVRLSLLGVAVVGLSACASLGGPNAATALPEQAQSFVGQDVQLLNAPEARASAQERAKALLSQPLDQAAAVKLYLANSPAFQSLLAQGMADTAQARQSGRIANPRLSLERMSSAADAELTRILSFGLLDVLTWPQRRRAAEQAAEASRLTLANQVVQAVADVRQAWVEAVAARANLVYAQQVMDSAQASADLAARMQRVGNITVLERATQHMYATQASLALASAQHEVVRTRERLLRLLGLRAEQASAFQLPDRLPDLPKAPLSAAAVNAQWVGQRLDVKMAEHDWLAAAESVGLGRIYSLTDVEWALRSTRVSERADGASSSSRGHELSVQLPLFDWGELKRQRLDAQTWAAAQRYEAALINASSQVREAYSAYRTNWDVVKHYQSEVLPLRSRMSEENVYRYNGMLIGTLALLEDARAQVAVVQSALKAQTQFWLAEAALQTSLISNPSGAVSVGAAMASSASSAGGH